MNTHQSPESVADHLARAYAQAFGGKPSGRYRIAIKMLRGLWGRKRLYEDDISTLSRALYERGYVLIDLDQFLVVMSVNAFTNYRRYSDDQQP